MLSSYAGGRVYGESYGSAPARVVALHGWARTHADFAEVLAPFDAIALDLPGFGATPAPTEPWGSPEYATLVAAVLRDLPAPPVVLGHSLGGRVGIHLAASYPELLSGLVLTGAPLMRVASSVKPKPGYRAVRWLNKRGVVSEERMEAARKKYGSSDYANASPAMRPVHVRLVNETYLAQIDAARGPVELVWGAHDTAAPLESARKIADRFGDRATLTVVADGAHLLSDAFVAPLQAAIRRVLA